jgi:hypothetical protein
LREQLRREQEIVDLVRGIAEVEGPRKTAIIEGSVGEGVLQVAVLDQRPEGGAVRRVIEIADNRDELGAGGNDVFIDRLDRSACARRFAFDVVELPKPLLLK